MNDDFSRQVAAASLKKMFEGAYFDICTIDANLRALGVIPIKTQRDALQPLHCMHWDRMEPELREQVFQRVMALFAEATCFDLAAIDRTFGTSSPRDVAAALDAPGKRQAVWLLPFHRRA